MRPLSSDVVQLFSRSETGLLISRIVLALVGATSMPLLALGFSALVKDGPGLWSGSLLTVALVAGLVDSELGRIVEEALSNRLSMRLSLRLMGALNTFEGVAHLETPALQDEVHLARNATDSAPKLLISSLASTLTSAGSIIGLIVVVTQVHPLIAVIGIAATVPGAIAIRKNAASEISHSESEARHVRRQVFVDDLLVNPSAAIETRIYGSDRLLSDIFQRERKASDRLQLRLAATTSLRTGAAGLGPILGIALSLALSRSLFDLSSADSASLLVGAFVALRSMGADMNTLFAMHAALWTAGRMLRYITTVEERSQSPVGDIAAADRKAGGPPVVRPTDDTSPTSAPLLEFDDVWFRYGPDASWVLTSISFTIQPGETVALIGENGSGKSTLVKLAMGMYRPDRGQIRFRGQPLFENLQAAREEMSVLLQDFVAYELTLAENISIGRPEGVHHDKTILHAAELAGATPVVQSAPNGLDTWLSRIHLPPDMDAADEVAYLSGGQWQRVALARTIYGRRSLTFLDEPTSAADPFAEADLLRRFEDLRGDSASLIVTHRLALARLAERIIVLDAGSIAEEGTHEALLNTDGLYREAFTSQIEIMGQTEDLQTR